MNEHYDPRDDADREFLRRLRRRADHSDHERRPLRGHDGMKKITDFPEWNDDDDLYEDAFWYVFNQLGNLAPLAQAVQNIQVQGDSKFEWMKTTASYSLAGGTPPQQSTDKTNISVFISDTGSGRNLMNAPVQIDSIAGNGKEPYILGVTRIFQPNATIQCTVTNTDAVVTWNAVQLTLHGRKIFKGRQGS